VFNVVTVVAMLCCGYWCRQLRIMV